MESVLQKIQAAMMEKIPSPDLQKLLLFIQDKVKRGRRKYSQNFPLWDTRICEYTQEGSSKTADKDQKLRERENLETTRLPIIFSQVESFVSFAFAELTGKDNFYELVGTGSEDHKKAPIANAVLQHNLNKNAWLSLLPELLRYTALLGVCITKHWWVTERAKIWKTTKDENGMEFAAPEEAVVYQGNKIEVINPFSFFFDDKVSWDKVQMGDFCGNEFTLPKNELYVREGYVGVEFIEEMSQEVSLERRNISRLLTDTESNNNSGESTRTKKEKAAGAVVLDEIQIKIRKGEFKWEEEDLVTSNHPMIFVVTIANDSRIIQFKECTFPHNGFSYDVGHLGYFAPTDALLNVTDSASTIAKICEWLVNSRQTAWTQSITGTTFLDPAVFHTEDLREGNRVVRTRRGALTQPIGNYLHTVPYADSTASHFSDMQTLMSFLPAATGVSEHMTSSYSRGRRSAEQTTAVVDAASSRSLIRVRALFEKFFIPLGIKLLTNIQQGMEVKQLVKILGEATLEQQSPDLTGVVAIQSFIEASADDIAGNFNFVLSNLHETASKTEADLALKELLELILAKPELIPVLGVNVPRLVTTYLRNAGVRNPEAFVFAIPPLQMPMAGPVPPQPPAQ
jgi:hypothetical protein